MTRIPIKYINTLGLDTLEHRQLQQDLLCTYKVLFEQIEYRLMIVYTLLLEVTNGHCILLSIAPA